MAASKKVVLSADGATATVADATVSDILTTVISSNEVLTGTYALVQRGLILAGGMSIQNVRAGRPWNPFNA